MQLSEIRYNALKQYRGGRYTGPKITSEIRDFKNRGYIVAVSRESQDQPGSYCMNPTKWTITPLGEDALSEFEQTRQKQANEERQRRFQNKISVAQVLVPLITFILGLIVEHCAGLVSALSDLFGRWVK